MSQSILVDRDTQLKRHRESLQYDEMMAGVWRCIAQKVSRLETGNEAELKSDWEGFYGQSWWRWLLLVAQQSADEKQ